MNTSPAKVMFLRVSPFERNMVVAFDSVLRMEYP